MNVFLHGGEILSGGRSARPKVGYVPQSPAFDPGDPLTVADFFAAAIARYPVCLPLPRALRRRVEEGLMRAHGSFTVASALMSGPAMEQALMYPKQSVELDMTFQNVMSVNVPVYHYKTRTDDTGDIFPYGFANTSGELDGAVEALGDVFQSMLKLAQIEKTAQLLAEEIEKTRRRVNALEYVMIPQTQEAIRYISMKLDENDRATTTRLMKVKDMLLDQAIEEQRVRDQKAVEQFRS